MSSTSDATDPPTGPPIRTSDVTGTSDGPPIRTSDPTGTSDVTDERGDHGGGSDVSSGPARASLDADAAIEALGLQPHPEGGWFGETWRDEPADGSRGSGTAIHFLLRAGESSHWHTVDAVEIWHHHAGGALELRIAESGDGPVTVHRLGSDLAAGERPQVIVPHGAWQSARPVDEAVLVSCTVSPAFTFEGFVLAPPGWEPGAAS